MSGRAAVAVIDYTAGNLFSVRQACEWSGLDVTVTNEAAVVERADGIVLPGIGAFGDAMDNLRRLDLVDVLRHQILADRPILAICLGMQLLLTESDEMGTHKGLDVVPGVVRRVSSRDETAGVPLKVPQVGWNQVELDAGSVDRTPLDVVSDGSYFYFMHSYAAEPDDEAAVAARTPFGASSYCSAIHHRSVYAYQFHPERSGPLGLEMYRRFADLLVERRR